MTIIEDRQVAVPVPIPAYRSRRGRAAALVVAKLLLGVLVTVLVGELMSPVA